MYDRPYGCRWGRGPFGPESRLPEAECGRRYLATCYAGAYVRWAQDNGLLSEDTVRSIVRYLTEVDREGSPANAIPGLTPTWDPHLPLFNRGYNSDQSTPNPDVCENQVA
jgi:hypothetical protein